MGVLLCALLQDNGRTLFLEKCENGKACFTLPCVMADEKENFVELVKKTVLEKTGIDCNVGMVALSGKQNAGSRRRKRFVNVLAFKATAKSYSTKEKAKWIALSEIGKMRLCRESEWLKAR